ncbi:histidinol dehydrogenase, partial [Rhodobacteraceae bacterium R_SAG3]|nr:histidinol dehydrogenase [Rhodobacteraceae bacterium R_SAG3]
MPVFLTSSDADFEQSFAALLGAKREDSPDVDAIVADIIADVRHRGDAALLELTEKFDRLALKDANALRISAAEVDAAIATVSDAERSALELAADRIRAYHAEQM